MGLCETIQRLQADRLDTMALPHGLKSWEECSDKFDDIRHQFLWLVGCFSGGLTARTNENRASDLVTTSLVQWRSR